MKGTGVVDGIAIGKVYVLWRETFSTEKREIDDVSAELLRLKDMTGQAAVQLGSLIRMSEKTCGSENALVFDYQLLLLEDDQYLGEIHRVIENERVSAEYAVSVVSSGLIEQFSSMDDPYLKARAADIADLMHLLQTLLAGRKPFDISRLAEPCIIAAEDLTPSQTASLTPDTCLGIVTEKGSPASHSVIIARALGIPCIIGVKGLLESIETGQEAIINGSTGEIILSPDKRQREEFEAQIIRLDKQKELISPYIHRATITRDGYEMKLMANITSDSEIDLLHKNGGEGVGLLRTEFIYMSVRSTPSRATQAGVYGRIAGKLNGLPLIIRTLDAGGDKGISYLGIGHEENPFLGWRAIRYCLDQPEQFKIQLAAILEVAAGYKGIEIMFPMISTLSELRRAKMLLNETREELSKEGLYPEYRLGMMIETPAAAIMADEFAKEVDFFSIGSNDLTQYLFAADRTNKKVAHLNSAFHPALLRLINHVSRCAHDNGIAVDICGQAGEERLLVPLWVAMGIGCLSVSIPSIPRLRKLICSLDKSKLLPALNTVLSMSDADQVKLYLSDFSNSIEGEKHDQP